MSRTLYRLGHLSARRRGTVVIVWFLLLGSVLGAAATVGGELRDAFSIPGTESQEAFDLLEDRFPQFAGSTAVVVAAGQHLQAAQPQLQALVAQIRDIEGVSQVSEPFAPGSVNPTATALRLTVAFAAPAQEVEETTFAQLTAAVDAAASPGVELAVGGEVASALSREEPGGTTESIGLLVAVLVLAIAFGQLRAMGLTLLTALTGVAVSIGTVLLLARVVEIPSVAEVLGLMIGLAVGIDYALFIVSRHREQVRAGVEVQESIARALATAGGAVVFAGTTVIIAMAGLLLVGIPFISLLAMSVVLAVVMAVLVATTLLPALLAYAGQRITRVTLPGLRRRPDRHRSTPSVPGGPAGSPDGPGSASPVASS